MRKVFGRICASMLFLVLAMVPAGMAHAGTWSCQVSNIVQDNGGGFGGFYIYCTSMPSGVGAFSNWVGKCAGAPATADLIKVWHSMATAALLSGKTLQVTYDNAGTCGSAGTTQALSLLR
jgi:hypothetical protein